jgi:hypothetical protein
VGGKQTQSQALVNDRIRTRLRANAEESDHGGQDKEVSMIKQLDGFPDNVLAFRCTGRVTRADYDTVLVPAVVDALGKHDKLRVYYETGDDFGLDPGAIWEDFKVGVEHLSRWEKVAVVTDVDWIKAAVRFFSFMMPATTRAFVPSEAAQARAWIST